MLGTENTKHKTNVYCSGTAVGDRHKGLEATSISKTAPQVYRVTAVDQTNKRVSTCGSIR